MRICFRRNKVFLTLNLDSIIEGQRIQKLNQECRRNTRRQNEEMTIPYQLLHLTLTTFLHKHTKNTPRTN